MSSYLWFKVIHILALFLVFAALGALTLHSLNGGTRESNRGHKMVGMSHGIGLLLILLTGFAMLPTVSGGGGVPGWAWGKMVLWLGIGAMIALIRRLPGQAQLLWFLLPLLGAVGAWLALFKPF